MEQRSGEIGRAFEAAAREDRAALVVYVTAGYPTPGAGLDALLEVADAGADVIELGVPFSDPLADGPTIQLASFRAIELGVDLEWTLELLRRFRALRPTPVVIFSYLNPILDRGVERFLEEAVDAGADGVLLTDLPVDADRELEELFEKSPLDLVRLIAPTTTIDRARAIAARSQGFIYYISRTGVTGARDRLASDLAEKVRALREVTDRPVAVGFGISTAEQASAVASVADGIAVGSALVDTLGRAGVAAAGQLVRDLRVATARAAIPG